MPNNTLEEEKKEIRHIIMDFQIQVRKETGGNNHDCVDATKTIEKLEELLTSQHNSTLDSIKEAVEKIDVDYYDNQIDTTTGSEMVEEFLAIIDKLKR